MSHRPRTRRHRAFSLLPVALRNGEKVAEGRMRGSSESDTQLSMSADVLFADDGKTNPDWQKRANEQAHDAINQLKDDNFTTRMDRFSAWPGTDICVAGNLGAGRSIRRLYRQRLLTFALLSCIVIQQIKGDPDANDHHPA